MVTILNLQACRTDVFYKKLQRIEVCKSCKINCFLEPELLRLLLKWMSYNISENSGKSSNKSKNGKANASEKLILLSKVELDNLVQRLVANAIEPLEAEIKA